MMRLTQRRANAHCRGHLSRWSVLGSILLAGVFLLGAGCAHYNFADAGNREHDGDEHFVSVWTVAAPADEGLDTARLTRAFVGALERRGQPARWESKADARAPSVRCSVAETDVDGFDQTLFGRAEVLCRLAASQEAAYDEIAATGRYTASVDVGAADLVAGHAQIQEAAALDALEAIADELVRREYANE